MRVRVPVLAYLAALCAGSMVFAVTMGIVGNLGLFLLAAAFFAFLFGGFLALPVALPVIIVTERWGKGPWWLFLVAGVFSTLLILGMGGVFGSGASKADAWAPLLFLLPTTVSAAMTYWFIAWKRWGPQPDFSSAVELFE